MKYSEYLKIQRANNTANNGTVAQNQPIYSGGYSAQPVSYSSMLGAVSPYSSQGNGQQSAGIYGNYINAQALANSGNNVVKNAGMSGAGMVGYSSVPTSYSGNVTYGSGTQSSGSGTVDSAGNNGVTYGDAAKVNGDNTATDTGAGNRNSVATENTPVRTDGVYGDYLAQREKAISDAQNSYAAFTSRYGTQAEQMAQSGMTGSGYADYMKSRAYSQMRDETQAANATYAENVRRADATIREAYANDLIGVNNGTYTEADIEALASKNGYSTEQVEALKNAAAEYTKNAQQSQYRTLIEKAKSGVLTINELISEYENKSISDDHLNVLANEIIPNMYKDSEGKIITREEAQKKLDEVMKEFGDSSDVYKNATKQYNNLFSNSGIAPQDSISGLGNVSTDELEESGNNFSVTIDGVKYHLESKGDAGRWNGATDYAKERGFNTDTLFRYNNKIYFYRDGKVYEIGTRENSYKNDLSNLLKVLNGG